MDKMTSCQACSRACTGASRPADERTTRIPASIRLQGLGPIILACVVCRRWTSGILERSSKSRSIRQAPQRTTPWASDCCVSSAHRWIGLSSSAPVRRPARRASAPGPQRRPSQSSPQISFPNSSRPSRRLSPANLPQSQEPQFSNPATYRNIPRGRPRPGSPLPCPLAISS
ncbi:hypothetical protein L227DRAFT_262706 [Lentinus tigrinus ALCF2SS1-6]|uniref:Uncharacterized protein n=1 Tax=Lentinus tigrinus ALCF2SS1-6 TaxID=1328759 RepID=A0A5C2SN89_9APHY|nr:hypothetical protein L227DRAFT_262706 [Lentinus tigrinus ALCF2SS1-6]